jgi:hypothetical protein
MISHFKCSDMNFYSSLSFACDKGISFLGRDAEAPGFSSIAWSHILDRINSCEASSLNTQQYLWYCGGILLSWSLMSSFCFSVYVASSR